MALVLGISDMGVPSSSSVDLSSDYLPGFNSLSLLSLSGSIHFTIFAEKTPEKNGNRNAGQRRRHGKTESSDHAAEKRSQRE
jgi:hypothetical protein